MSYIVKRGDTPGKIAGILGVDVDDIMAIEDAFSRPGDPRTLQIGAEINIDGEGATDTKLTDYTDAETTRFNGLPGQPEVWKVDGRAYVVYFAPTEPPVPLLFSVPSEEDLSSFFGDQDPKYDKVIRLADAEQSGAIVFGSTDTIPTTEGDPWAGFVERMERAREVQPWLEDPEVFAIVSGAWLEGRAPEQWEFESTEWWQTHNEAQREWMWMSMRDPESAARFAEDNQVTVYELFRSIGIDDPDDGLVRYLADQFTQGNWSKQRLEEQVAAITGDDAYIPIDAGLSDFMATGGITVADPTLGRQAVRDLFTRWLGPAYPPSEAQIDEWSAKIRRDQAAGTASLTEMLRAQRKALYPEYDDENLTYEDMAAPWRGFTASIWGQQPDETDSLFQQVVRMNDSYEASKLLRKEGLARNIGKVRQDALKGLGTQVSNTRVTM